MCENPCKENYLRNSDEELWATISSQVCDDRSVLEGTFQQMKRQMMVDGQTAVQAQASQENKQQEVSSPQAHCL